MDLALTSLFKTIAALRANGEAHLRIDEKGSCMTTERIPQCRIKHPKLSNCCQKVVPKVRVELTRSCPHRFLSLVRTILVSRLIVLTNVWVRRFCHQVPSGQNLIPINETALHGSNEFGLASSRVSASRAKARRDHGVHERPLGPCLEFDSPPSPPGTPFRRLRLILSLVRLIYQNRPTSRPGGNDFE